MLNTQPPCCRLFVPDIELSSAVSNGPRSDLIQYIQIHNCNSCNPDSTHHYASLKYEQQYQRWRRCKAAPITSIWFRLFSLVSHRPQGTVCSGSYFMVKSMENIKKKSCHWAWSSTVPKDTKSKKEQNRFTSLDNLWKAKTAKNR